MLGLNWAFLLQLGARSSSFSVVFLLHASTVFMAVGKASQDLPYFLVSSLLLAPGDISAAAHHLDLALPALFLYPLCSGSQPCHCSPFQAGLSQPPACLPLLLTPEQLELQARYSQSPRSLQDARQMQLTLMNLSSQDTSLHTTLIATYVYALNFSRKHGGTNVTVWGKKRS